MIPRFKPDLDIKEIIAAFTLPRADDVEKFEQAFAQTMGQKHAVAFPYGRTGLVILLEALGLKDEEIICPSYTCVVVPHAIVTSGNKPVFVDSQDKDFNMDLNLVPKVISNKTGAIIATSIFGYPVDLDALEDIRKKNPRIKIIQDCAHSFAAEWNGRPVQQAGDAAIFGLNISKLMTSIFGGMVTTDDDGLALRLRELRDARLKPASRMKSLFRLLYLLAVYPAYWPPLYGAVNILERRGYLDRFVKYYDESIIDMPCDYLEAMTGVEARVGRVQVHKYHDIIKRHQERAAAWFRYLEKETAITLPPEIEGATYSHFVCLVENRQLWEDRFMKKGIQLGELIEYSIPYMKAYSAGREEEFPVSKKFSLASINFPLGNDL